MSLGRHYECRFIVGRERESSPVICCTRVQLLHEFSLLLHVYQGKIITTFARIGLRITASCGLDIERNGCPRMPK